MRRAKREQSPIHLQDRQDLLRGKPTGMGEQLRCCRLRLELIFYACLVVFDTIRDRIWSATTFAARFGEPEDSYDRRRA